MGMVLKSILSVVVLCVILPEIAFAHGVKIFAAAEGDLVKGYVYYAGGSRIQNAEIIVLGPDDKKLGQVKTDADGSFAYKTDLVIEHRFVMQTSHGHRAEVAVPARVASQEKQIGSAARSYTKSFDLHTKNNKDLEEMINKVVEHEVNTVREQLALHDEKVRLRDIIGGIGYIFGLVGIAGFFQGRKKRQKADGPV